MKIVIVIPARWKSKRFPGKPLAIINNKEMILHVWEKAKKVRNIQRVVVATDNKKILNFCRNKKIDTILTSTSCKTGTDRVTEISEKISADIYVNLQGDEPLINPGNIEKVILGLRRSINNRIQVSTGYTLTKNKQNKNNSNVYLIKSKEDNVVYLSRKELPLNYDKNFCYLKHIGIFAFTKNALKLFSNSNIGILEKKEKIELIRFLENDVKVKAIYINETGLAVDYQSDIKKIENYIKRK